MSGVNLSAMPWPCSSRMRCCSSVCKAFTSASSQSCAFLLLPGLCDPAASLEAAVPDESSLPFSLFNAVFALLGFFFFFLLLLLDVGAGSSSAAAGSTSKSPRSCGALPSPSWSASASAALMAHTSSLTFGPAASSCWFWVDSAIVVLWRATRCRSRLPKRRTRSARVSYNVTGMANEKGKRMGVGYSYESIAQPTTDRDSRARVVT